MDELIKRLENATGPDRQLDRMIEETLPGVERHMYADMVKDGYVISGEGHSIYGPGQGYLPAHYTASIDAALTLVADGVDVELCRDLLRPGVKLWFAYLSVGDPRQTKFVPCEGRADTGAIALCIAALKARGSLASTAAG